jgi:hypothetical protein
MAGRTGDLIEHAVLVKVYLLTVIANSHRCSEQKIPK